MKTEQILLQEQAAQRDEEIYWAEAFDSYIQELQLKGMEELLNDIQRGIRSQEQ